MMLLCISLVIQVISDAGCGVTVMGRALFLPPRSKLEISRLFKTVHL
jgi:hypothetical protein